ncbi:MAG: outer-membrane lipoprotein carrier protein LolA [Hyphomicrobiales bacterium]
MPLKTRLRSLAAALAVTAAVATAAVPTPLGAAFAPDQEAVISRASSYINSITTMQGEFVQVGPDGQRVEGTFIISRPGRLLFRYNPPVRVEIVADGKAVVIRDKKLKTQDLYPLNQTPLRFLVSEKADLERDSKVLDVYSENDMSAVVVEEKTPLGTGKIKLLFDAATFELRQWTVTDAQGQETSVALYNIETGKSVDPGLFWIDHYRR